MSTTNRIVKACHKIGRLVCFSPSMGDFQIFETREYLLDLMKKRLSLAADFWILRVDHVLREGIRINPNPLTLLFSCYLNTLEDAKELDFEYGLVLNCLRERIYPLFCRLLLNLHKPSHAR